jgi:hypothetical protein
MLTDSTGIGGLTEITQSALRPEPSMVAAVMMAVPSATAVTRPVSSTVATAVSLDDQETVFSVPLDGDIVAVSWVCLPMSRVTSSTSNPIPVAYM